MRPTGLRAGNTLATWTLAFLATAESIVRAGCAGAPAHMGKNKPWKHIGHACEGVMHGRLTTTVEGVQPPVEERRYI